MADKIGQEFYSLNDIAGGEIYLVLAELPDSRKYEYLSFPESDVWGLVIPEDDPLADNEEIHISDLKGIPLFFS